MDLTYNEKITLDCIARNCYQPTNYGRPDTYEDTAPIWTYNGLILDSDAADKPALKSLPGIMASLNKKGLVRSFYDAAEPKSSTATLTEAGFAAWLVAFPAAD